MKKIKLVLSVFFIYIFVSLINFPILAQKDTADTIQSQSVLSPAITEAQVSTSVSSSSFKTDSLLGINLDALVGRLSASLNRLNRISAKILSRLDKISVLEKDSAKNLAKIKTLSSKNDSLKTQLDQMKTDLANIEEATNSLILSSHLSSDYKPFRSDVVAFNLHLKKILISQASIAGELEQFKNLSATPSAAITGSANL